jgi:predicted nucleic acid-binding protein
VILLDTNVVSELMRREPDSSVIRWLDAQPATSVWITSITVLEIEFGLLTIPESRRREAMKVAFAQILDKMIESRVASFDKDAGSCAAKLMAARKRRGRPGDLRDTMIAGIVISTGATLATRNASHFDDLPGSVINPWKP